MLRIAIVGAGAIGCLFAATLTISGNEVLLVHNNDRLVSEIRKRGVRLHGMDGRSRAIDVPIMLGPTKLMESDVILFAVKAYNTAKVASQYRGRIRPDAAILTLQNGLGNIEVLSHFFGKTNVIAGSTTEAALLLRPGIVNHTGKGRTVIGELDGSLTQRSTNIAVAMRGAGFRSSVTRNVHGVVWCKAILNSAINPVSALTRLRNGELMDETGLRRDMLAVLEEGVRVARREAVRLDPRDPRPLLFRTLRATHSNMSSMLQDVLRGRRTEVRELNGEIVKRGTRLGISTPYNQILLSLVLGLEKQYT